MILSIALIALLVIAPTAATVALLRMDRPMTRPVAAPRSSDRQEDWHQAA